MIPLSRSRESIQLSERSLGVLGGVEPRADADFLLKLSEAAAGRAQIVFEARAPAGVHEVTAAGASRTRPTLAAAAIDPGSTAAGKTEPELTAAAQLDILDSIVKLAERGVHTIVMPCYPSHGFLDELQANSPLPIADMLAALRDHVRSHFPTVRRIGVVTSEQLRSQGLFQRYFPRTEFEILYSAAVDGECSVELLRSACADLLEQGAQLIIPGRVGLIAPAQKAGPVGVPVIDPHRVYANYVVAGDFEPPPRAFRLGVVGGVGPAATVDFLRKVVRNTPAHRDQDHLKILVEQNPQIPDRTAHLLGRGPDPTLALYATCKRLQAGQADLIAIPCNTAHAFVGLIQPHLDIPIINMLDATVSHVRKSFPGLKDVGLLATTGTLSSGIYHRALQSQGLHEVVPPPALQERMMEAIYGSRGIKAGFTSGQCVDDIHAVIDELVSRGVEVVILGCTELPLLFNRGELTSSSGQRVALVDPTEILAERCVHQAMARSPR
ncbi:MAG TPA: amino acid racemase [Steroidobacteraceae bacterium]|nr:amino acid racemase [Steroidobacteraceae bacterium]